MKRAQARKALDAVFVTLGDAMAACFFESHLSVSAFRDSYDPLLARIKAARLASGGRKSGVGELVLREMGVTFLVENMHAHCPRTISIGSRGVKDEKILGAFVGSLNAQNLWLLVSAYEAYERFFKDLFGALGYLDRNLWRCSDYGETRLQDVARNGIRWHQQRAREVVRKNGGVKHVFSRLYDAFPSFREREEAEPPLNLRAWCKIAGVLRHRIVHSQACGPEEELIAELEKASGMCLRPKTPDACVQAHTVMQYLRTEGNVCQIQGIEHRCLETGHGPLNRPTTFLMEKLATHACLAYSTAMEHFGEMPVWERAADTLLDQ